MLPTDIRFKKLSEDQKWFLLCGFLEKVSDEEMRFIYNNRPKAEITDELADALETRGYTRAQIKRMRAELEKAGLADGHNF